MIEARAVIWIEAPHLGKVDIPWACLGNDAPCRCSFAESHKVLDHFVGCEPRPGPPARKNKVSDPLGLDNSAFRPFFQDSPCIRCWQLLAAAPLLATFLPSSVLGPMVRMSTSQKFDRGDQSCPVPHQFRSRISHHLVSDRRVLADAGAPFMADTPPVLRPLCFWAEEKYAKGWSTRLTQQKRNSLVRRRNAPGFSACVIRHWRHCF